MSRRLRQEAEKLKQLNDELQGQEDKIKLQKERIYAPLVWKRLGSGICIQDLKPKYYDEVLKIIEDHYVIEEVLCRNTNIKNDETSLHSLLHRVLINLKDETSLIALNENKDEEVAGFLILKVVNKNDFGHVFSRVELVDGEAHKKIVNFSNFISRKSDIFAMFNCETYLRCYLLCIKPEYRKKGLGLHLMLSAVEVARTLRIPVLMGMFTNFSMQKIAKKVGMKMVFEMNYVDWLNRFGEMIFDEPGAGNYSYAVMAGELPPTPLPLPSVSEKNVEPEMVKMTRDEKRKSKDKKAAKK